jgi:3-oxoadipyl-CoA thiolase
MTPSYIIDSIRTAVGNLGGSLSAIRADDLAALPIIELIRRNPNIPPDAIADVILGCHNQAGEDNRNVARMALLLAGLPYTVPGETVNRLCSSGMSAVVHANRAIKAGDGDVLIAGGIEHMTRGPMVMSKASKAFGNDVQIQDSSFGWRFINPKLQKMYGTEAMGLTAENLAEMYNISREDQDLFALRSQQKAYAAQQNGILAEEIVGVELPALRGGASGGIFDKDEFIKGNSTIEGLAKLKPSFKKENGTVTAGNASGLNDGAAAMFIVSENALKTYHLTPKVRIVSSAVVGVEPRIMGIGPEEASRQALKKAGLTLNNIDVIEFNEAFAAQCLAVSRNLGLADDDERINPNGGAIAIGHPLGMSGTRIIQAATNQLVRTNKRYALAAMCVGVGMGYAVILEKV